MSEDLNPFGSGPQAIDANLASIIVGDDDDEYVASSDSSTKYKKSKKDDDKDKDLQNFMEQKDRVLKDLEIIVEKTNEITKIAHELDEKNYGEDEINQRQKTLLENVKSGDYRASRAKKKLNQLKKSTKQLKKSSDKRVKAQIQIRRNITQTLSKRFIEVTRDLQEAKGAHIFSLKLVI